MLALPATPNQVLAEVIAPTFDHLLPRKFATPEAAVLLLAIGMQESGFRTRRQVGGPARGLWQAEQGGMVHGVLTSKASSQYMRSVCQLRAVAPVESDIYAALLSDDLLACAVARLGLWCEPSPLPAVGDADAAWAYYLRTWRPGKPRPDDWASNYGAALAAIGEEAVA